MALVDVELHAIHTVHGRVVDLVPPLDAVGRESGGRSAVGGNTDTVVRAALGVNAGCE